MATISAHLLQEFNDGHREAQRYKKDKMASAVKIEVASEDEGAAGDLNDEAIQGTIP